MAFSDLRATTANLSAILTLSPHRSPSSSRSPFTGLRRLTRLFRLSKGLPTAPILQLPDFKFKAGFIVECNAFGTGFDAVLHQGTGPLAFFNKPIAACHAKLAAYERELIGLVHAIRH